MAVVRLPSLAGHPPQIRASRRLPLALALALAAASPLATLALATLAALAATRAQAEVVAIDRSGAASPVLWNGGVAWLDPAGVHAAAPGTPAHSLVSYQPRGFTYGFSLDSGSGAGNPAGALAYGWEEANEMTPPMGPGDTSVPTPPLPYETSLSRRGVIGADGHVTALPGCATEDVPVGYGAYAVSLAQGTVAYRCDGVPPGAPAPATPAPAASTLSSYLALGEIATPATPTRTIPQAGSPFQISGPYLAYYAAGKTTGSGSVVVENRQTGTVSYEVPHTPQEEPVQALALQADGTLVLLGGGTSSTCPPATARAGRTYPAAWFSPASPSAHQLGCFYDGSLRPVGGQWVALRSSGANTTAASLVLLTLADGSSRTLANFANAGVFETQPQELQPQPLATTPAAADFDGKRLAWTEQTCAGTAVQFAPDVNAMSPGPPRPSARCPALLHIHGALRATAKGNVKVRVSCPQGCQFAELSIAQPRDLRTGPALISLPASSADHTETLHLTRRQRAYLRAHRRVRIALVALSNEPGSTAQSRYVTHAVLTGG
jgi:hypothetical protein